MQIALATKRPLPALISPRDRRPLCQQSDQSVENAIDAYNRLLEQNDPQSFAETLQQRMWEGRVQYGDRLICQFLRPNLVSRSQLKAMQLASNGVHSAMNAMAAQVLANRSLQDFVGMTAAERRLAMMEPGYEGFCLSGRADGFMVGNQIRFVEYNGESPLGHGYLDNATTAFASTSLMRKFRKTFACQPLYTGDRILSTLLDAFRSWGGKEKPVIAIVDFTTLHSHHEFEILRAFFSSRGYRTVVADPRDLELGTGQELTYRGERIHLVFRRLLVNEMLDEWEGCQSLVKAVAARTVCMVNPFRNKVFHKKAMFALLTDPCYQGVLNAEQRQAVAAHLPWTRMLSQLKTTGPAGNSIDLLSFIVANREQLVLKPNDEYGGKGVAMGWTMGQSEWESALREALVTPHLVQARVEVSRRRYPSWVNGCLDWSEYTTDINPFVFGGRMAGALARLSPSALCNICAGGGTVPTFVLN